MLIRFEVRLEVQPKQPSVRAWCTFHTPCHMIPIIKACRSLRRLFHFFFLLFPIISRGLHSHVNFKTRAPQYAACWGLSVLTPLLFVCCFVRNGFPSVPGSGDQFLRRPFSQINFYGWAYFPVGFSCGGGVTYHGHSLLFIMAGIGTTLVSVGLGFCIVISVCCVKT